MGSDEKLAEVLSEFARTMLTDFSIERILDRLVERIVDVMPVSGAGVTLMSPRGVPRYVAASDRTALGFERLQFDLGEGPCMDVYENGQAVCVANLGEETRFPKFTRGASSRACRRFRVSASSWQRSARRARSLPADMRATGNGELKVGPYSGRCRSSLPNQRHDSC